MADRFAADPREAERVAGELRTIRSALADPGGLFAGAEATGSRRVQAALERFRDNSSDSREHLAELLDRAAGMLTGLAQGVDAVDQALAESFTVESDPAAAGSPEAVTP